MQSYRSAVYDSAMAVSAEATRLAMTLADYTSQRNATDRSELLAMLLPTLTDQGASLSTAVDQFVDILPKEVPASTMPDRGLLRHRYWIRRRIKEGLPQGCSHDPVDIIKNDIPDILRRFNEWYDARSEIDDELKEALLSLINAGQLDSALRKAWAIFKSRMTDAFNLSQDLDGHKLVEELFSDDGALIELMDSKERNGYANLLKGLYTLNRNPVVHNDVTPSPTEVDATIAMIHKVLVTVENAHQRETELTFSLN